MPLFSYTALDQKGKKKAGIVEAHNIDQARRKLRDQELMVTKIDKETRTNSRENIKGEALVSFTMQLSQLVNAGVPIYESLLALEEQYRNEPFDRILLSLCEQIKSGVRLSDAMSRFPETFNGLYCSMIAAGESSGALDKVLEELAVLLSKQDKLRQEIKTAMIYPAILAGFCSVLIVVLLGFVIPSIEVIFEGRDLNGFTTFVLTLSHIFTGYWWIYIPIMGGAIGYGVYALRKETGKLWLERQLLKLPLISKLMIEAAVARFCRTLGTLQQGGLTIIESLQISREVMQNHTLQEEIEKAEARIVEGSSLSEELSKSKRIPQMVARMLAVGEESGTSVVMLYKLAEMYEEHLEKTLQRLMALAQPVILIIMGLVIGTVILAVLLPLADMSSFKV